MSFLSHKTNEKMSSDKSKTLVHIPLDEISEKDNNNDKDKEKPPGTKSFMSFLTKGMTKRNTTSIKQQPGKE